MARDPLKGLDTATVLEYRDKAYKALLGGEAMSFSSGAGSTTFRRQHPQVVVNLCEQSLRARNHPEANDSEESFTTVSFA